MLTSLLIVLSILQFIDDVLDFTSSSGELGKPNLNDIKSGVVTAPVLYAAEQHPELIDMIQRKFKADGDVSRANELVFDSNGIERTRDMAEKHCALAAQMVCSFVPVTVPEMHAGTGLRSALSCRYPSFQNHRASMLRSAEEHSPKSPIKS